MGSKVCKIKISHKGLAIAGAYYPLGLLVLEAVNDSLNIMLHLEFIHCPRVIFFFYINN